MPTPKKVWVSTGQEPKRSCPVCFARLDGATCLSMKPDRPASRPVMHVGDLTMCAYCGTYLILESAYGFRFAGPDDLARLPPELRLVMQHFPARHKRPPV